MFDPYSEWLGLTDPRRPPTLYQLLGITPADPTPVVEGAVARQLTKVQAHLTGANSSSAWQLVDEITLAKNTLLDPVKRAAYDAIYAFGRAPVPTPAPPPAPVSSWAAQMPPPAPSASPLPPWVVEEQARLAPPVPMPAPNPVVPPSFDVHADETPSGDGFPLHNETPSSDGLPSAPTLTNTRRPRGGNHGLLLVAGGLLALAFVGGAAFLVFRGSNIPQDTDKKIASADNVADSRDLNPPTATRREPTKEPKIVIVPKKKDPPKTVDIPVVVIKDPPPKTEPKKELPPVTVAAGFKEDKNYKGHKRTVRALAVAADGKQFLTVGDEKAVMTWTFASDEPESRPSLQGEGIGAAFLPDGKQAVVGDGSGAYLIDLAANVIKKSFTGRNLVALATCSDPTHFLSVNKNGDLEWWDIAKIKAEKTIGGKQKAEASCLALSPDGQLAVIGFRTDGNVAAVNLKSGAIVKKWKMHTQDVIGAAFSPDGKRVVTVGQDNLGNVWDPLTGSKLATLKGHTDVPIAAAFSPDGSLIFTGGIDLSIRTWDAKSGAMQKPYKVTDKVFSLAVDPTNRFLVAGLGDSSVQLIMLPGAKMESPKKESE